MARHMSNMHNSRPGGGGGVGGGTRNVYWCGCALAHQKKGGLRCGHSPKRGVLGAGTASKRGGGS